MNNKMMAARYIKLPKLSDIKGVGLSVICLTVVSLETTAQTEMAFSRVANYSTQRYVLDKHSDFSVTGKNAEAFKLHKTHKGEDRHVYSTSDDHVGGSLAVSEFKVAPDTEQVKVTLIARYSPKGAPEFGFAQNDGKVLQKIGAFSDVSSEVPDSHQRIFPSAIGKEPTYSGEPSYILNRAECPSVFGFYYTGAHYVSLTSPGKSKGAKIKHTERIYAAPKLLGASLKDAYYICFEEASNGDYQDIVFYQDIVLLVEGITPITSQ